VIDEGTRALRVPFFKDEKVEYVFSKRKKFSSRRFGFGNERGSG
jgi:hypothetical protein